DDFEPVTLVVTQQGKDAELEHAAAQLGDHAFADRYHAVQGSWWRKVASRGASPGRRPCTTRHTRAIAVTVPSRARIACISRHGSRARRRVSSCARGRESGGAAGIDDRVAVLAGGQHDVVLERY